MLHVRTTLSVVAEAIEIHTDRLIGAVSTVVVPGLPDTAPLEPVVHNVGWAHDWDAANQAEEYLPVCLGVDDDYHALVSEIEKRAHEARA